MQRDERIVDLQLTASKDFFTLVALSACHTLCFKKIFCPAGMHIIFAG